MSNASNQEPVDVSDLMAVRIKFIEFRVLLVLSINVLSNVGDIQKLVFKILRVLKPFFPIFQDFEESDVELSLLFV
jgi:hypothetical protein